MNRSHLHEKRKGIILLLLAQLVAGVSIAQVQYQSQRLHMVVSGTSTLHDWDMQSSKGTCSATFTFDATGQCSGLTALNFTMPAESLKSEHKSMDKNAYKALKTEQHPSIAYALNTATVAPDGTIKCSGRLTIAGVTLNEDLLATAKVNADKSITVKGSEQISMKNFNIAPPSFMMGTVKTGNNITVTFDVTLKH